MLRVLRFTDLVILLYSLVRHQIKIVWWSHCRASRYVSILFMRNLFLCRHVENISVRLFSRFFLSAFIIDNLISSLWNPFLRSLIPRRSLIKQSCSSIYGRRIISYGCCSVVWIGGLSYLCRISFPCCQLVKFWLCRLCLRSCSFQVVAGFFFSAIAITFVVVHFVFECSGVMFVYNVLRVFHAAVANFLCVLVEDCK